MRIQLPCTAQAALRDLGAVVGRPFAGVPLGEFVRYGAASAVAFAVDLGTLILLTEGAGIHYLTSAAAGFCLGFVVAYVLSVRWVFSARRLSSQSMEGAIFFLIGAGGLVLNHIAMFGLTEFVLLPYAVSKIGSAGLVFAFNFLLRKTVLFTVSTATEVDQS